MMKKCTYYIICENDEYINDLCYDCHMLFGSWRGVNTVLDTQDDLQCPLCAKISKCITRPKCDHFICTDCFKKLYYSNEFYIIKEKGNLSEYLAFENSCKKCLECSK
jgi:hypothetical protein